MNYKRTIKAKTRQEMADLLGISPDTLRRKLKEKGLVLPTGLLSPHYQKQVFEALWYPESCPKEAYEPY